MLKRYGTPSAIVRLAAIALIVCFFLPWGTVSCQGQDVGTFTGWELSRGAESVGVGPVVAERGGEEEILFVLFTGFAVLLLSGLVWLNRMDRPFASIAIIAFAVVSLGIIYANYRDLTDEASKEGGELELRYGGWGTAAALFTIIGAASADAILGRRQQTALVASDARVHDPPQPSD